MPDANIFMERRVDPRIKVNVPVKYRFLEDKKEIKTVLEHRKREKSALAMDISLGGMQITADQAIKEGDIMDFEITLPDLSEPLSAFAEVVWAKENTGGIHFVKLSEEDFLVLKVYVRKATMNQ